MIERTSKLLKPKALIVDDKFGVPLVRVEGFGFADGSMMMAVAFVLERSGVVVDRQTVTATG